MTITREKYMTNSSDLHDEYYKQFVTTAIINLVLSHIGKDLIIRSVDKHMNDIPLRKWDDISGLINRYSITKRNEAAEGSSIATGVCIGKAAARMIKELENGK